MPDEHNTKREAFISPEIDRELNRAMIRSGARVLVLWACVMLGVWIFYRSVPRAMEYSAAVNGVAAALFMGPAILTWRGFILRLKEIGKRLSEQGKYAQAARALEPFTRFGNRSFDSDGEAHYRLALAYLRLGEREKAGQIVAYLNRYRRRSHWQQEAQKLWNSSKKSDPPARS